MNIFKGYRTLILNGAVVLVAVLGYFGIIIPEELANEFALALVALVNVGLRAATNTEVGKSE